MHIYKGFSSCALKMLCYQRPLKIGRIRPLVKLYSSSSDIHQTLKVKPFWKFKAVLNNVSLTLCCKVEEDHTLVHPSSKRQQTLNIEYDDENRLATVRLEDEVRSELSISLPYQVDLDIVLKGSGSANVANIENEVIEIKAENYDIELGELKSNCIRVAAIKGDIRCGKTLKGNVDLETHDGDVETQKILGNSVSLSSKTGYTRAGDVYAEQLLTCSEKGAKIKSVHGRSRLRSKGSIVLGTAEGDVSVVSQTGDIDLHLADRAAVVDAVAKSGNIDISYSPSMSGELNISARSLEDSNSRLTKISDKKSSNCGRYRTSENDVLTRVTAKSPCGITTLRSRTWIEAISRFSWKLRK